jgi:UPF0755 protein
VKRRLAALFVAFVLAGAGWLAHDLYRPYRGYSRPFVLNIPPGSDAVIVTELLVLHGVLAHRLPFLLRYWAGRRHDRLKAGEYYFDRPLRPLDVYRKMVQGDVYLHPVVIPEGSNRFDIARILSERLGLDPTAFLRATEDTSLIRDLDPQAPSLEGYLFPDTYRFAQGVSAETIVARMLARFRQVIAARFPGEFPPGTAKLHEVITLASLVEKETPDPGERPRVAGVFARRLKRHMLLQCDPTVLYALRLAHQEAGPLTEADLQFGSPYNTYRHVGLPPGPIASPGVASIQAALHPSDDKALYFVSNRHGGHVFAQTLAEHRRNVSRYRREVAAEPHPAPRKTQRIRPPRAGRKRHAATSVRKSAKQP